MATPQRRLNGSERVVRVAVSVDDVIVEPIQHGKLLVERRYRSRIDKRVAAPQPAAFNRRLSAGRRMT
jgi:hypothetical protein